MQDRVVVRRERPKEVPAIWHVNEQAFGRPAEADVVDALRAWGKVVLSLVAAQDGRVVGHILISPVTVEPRGLEAVALGPMDVLPEVQRRGIGTRLVEAGLAECRDAGHTRVVVLGHPWFYPRFGFIPATA